MKASRAATDERSCRGESSLGERKIRIVEPDATAVVASVGPNTRHRMMIDLMSRNFSDTALRLIHLLQLVPRSRKKSTQKLMAELETLGYEVNIRTVQRDLEKLAEKFPVQSDGGKPAGWSWKPYSGDLSLPTMDPTVALTLLIVQKHVSNLLPHSIMEDLQPKFVEARRTLEKQGDSGIRRWPARIAVTSRALPMIPPDIKPGVQRRVFDALLRRRQLQARYLAAAATEANEYVVHPQGLVVKEGVLYLVALIKDYPDPRLLALHRFERVEVVELMARELPDFDVQAYVDQGGVSISTGQIVRLVAEIKADAGFHLTESRIAADQVIEPFDAADGTPCYRLTATLPESMRLKWWLQSFGDAMIQWRMQPVTDRPSETKEARQ